MKLSYPLMSVLLTAALAVPLAAQGNPAAASGNAASGNKAAAAPAAAQDGSQFDPLLDPGPLPKGPVSLIGGRVSEIDLIRDRLKVKVFGGGDMKIQFGSRSRIYRDGMETTALGIQKGDRVYLDTQLDRSTGKVFARNIRVVTAAAEGTANGQVMDYNARNGELLVQDRISGQSLRIHVDRATPITRHGQSSDVGALLPGALLDLKFAAHGNGSGTAESIDVLAEPGGNFVFSGRVTFVDLRSNLIAIENTSDGKNYTVTIQRDQVTPALVVGAHVTVHAQFNGRDYLAQKLVIEGGAQESSNNPPAGQ